MQTWQLNYLMLPIQEWRIIIGVISGLCDFLLILMWYAGKDRLFLVRPLNVSQLRPKILICLVIHFQHLSNGSICRDSPNCLGLWPTCAAQAARNVVLFFSTTACTVVPRSAEHVGAGPLIGRLAAVLAHEEGGAHHHWKLMFTTPPTPSGFKYKMQKLWT